MNALNKVIELSFYSLFFIVPLIFFGNTSELFEFNKMWLAFGLTIIIATAWIIKMILQKRIEIQKTPLDIPIFLFLGSQIISTLFSLDPHVSWWGYYSRFNGGLLSIVSYILLYYAFVSNLQVKHVLRALSLSLLCGIIVALWAFPAHFGYDPTCFLFRGTLDTSCWTEQFKPTIRTFSTLGQPAWLAAYLALLLPLSMVYALRGSSGKWKIAAFLLLSAFFYINLVFTNTRAGFIGFAIADVILFTLLFLKHSSKKSVLTTFFIVHLVFFISSFFFGSPGGYWQKYTFQEITKPAAPAAQENITTPAPAPESSGGTANAILITDSADIRKHVWKGAIDGWKANPIFGTGVETFAFAYYKYKPAEHNLTSEWDYLYNKAHNEYLNYLTTTGAFGLGTYLFMIGMFLFLATKKIISNVKYQMPNIKSKDHLTLVIALISGYVSILITNFFGFSVVIMNAYLFLIPAFIFLLTDMLDPEKVFSLGAKHPKHKGANSYQWTAIITLLLTSSFLLLSLFWYWYADVAYALGNNLDKAGQYQQAYPKLMEAVTTEPNEPVYKDELAINTAVLSTALYAQKDIENGSKFAQNAIALSDDVVTKHPNNVVYWKNRVRVLYTLSETTPENQQQYLMQAVQAIDKAAELAPNDAKIAYNQGVLHGQTGDVKRGIDTLEHTLTLKPDYKDAYFALGLFYHQLAVDKDGKIIDPALQGKAEEKMEYILKNLSSKDKQIEDTLKDWGASK